ncbi:MAG: cyclic nucleotide-binding domain-containing protein [Planctomycetaceae bacterium]|nr:cyclic nucleotide-binding domain-containing protein [Planctomycetaceae bacterium]
MLKNIFGRYPLYSLLNSDQLELCEAASLVFQFRTGESIFQEGTTGAWLHIVLNGRIRVCRTSTSGREISLGMASAGEVLGDYILLSPHKHTATCRASTDATILRIPIQAILEVLDQIPGVTGQLKSFLRLHAAVHFLREQQFLGFMQATSALIFLPVFREERFHAGTTIRMRGIADNRWFFIQNGNLTLYQPNGTVHLAAGECFGAEAFIGRACVHKAHAASNLRCVSMNIHDFRNPYQHAESSLDQSLKAMRSHCRHLPWISQQAEADCGLACLAMIAEYFGKAVSLDELRQRWTVHPNGVSFRDLEQISDSVGLRATAVRIDVDHLESVSMPVVVNRTDSHYVVVFQVDGEILTIGDPATGIYRLHLNEFKKLWGGHLMLFSRRSENAMGGGLPNEYFISPEH